METRQQTLDDLLEAGERQEMYSQLQAQCTYKQALIEHVKLQKDIDTPSSAKVSWVKHPLALSLAW